MTIEHKIEEQIDYSKLPRLKLGFISADSPIVVAAHMYREMDKRGHDCVYIPNSPTLVEWCNFHKNKVSVGHFTARANPFSIKEFFKFKGFDAEELDVIFVEQNFMYFENDVETPVIYYHRDLWNDAFVRKPDMLLYRYANHFTSLQYYARYTWGNTPFKHQFRNGVDLTQWHPEEKIYEGLNYIYPRKPLEWYLQKDFIQRDYYMPTYKILEYARSKDWVNVHGYHKITREEYVHLLQSMESILFMPPANAYLSRVLYEAAACKTMLVIYVHNDWAKQQYNRIGLVHGDNCVMVRDKREINNTFQLLNRKREKIVENAYIWVQNHTYEKRADLLERIFYKLVENYQKIEEAKKKALVK